MMMTDKVARSERLPKRLHLKVIAAVLQAVAELEGWGDERASIQQAGDSWLTTCAGHPMPSTRLHTLANEHYRRMLAKEQAAKARYEILSEGGSAQ